jgi:hypothetical protein
LFPDENAIGFRLKLDGVTEWLTIIAAGNVKQAVPPVKLTLR